MKKWGAIIFILLMGVLWQSSAQIPSHAQDDEGVQTPLVILNENNIKQATVLVMQVSDETGSPVIRCMGSGTLVSADGLILTNAHLVTENQDCVADRVVIALTIRIDEPPIPSYTAEIVEINRGFDLAVLQITRGLDGRFLNRSQLQLPFVELGDSNQVNLDDTITFFGYPEIQNDPIDIVRGTVSGFTSESQVGQRAWIRTAAEVPGLMSGGGVYNQDGRLIGVPTVLPGRVAGILVDCRYIYDTNGDGQIDDDDGCIPIGGTIRAIRPSRLARGLVQAAALGIQPGIQLASYETPPTGSQPIFENPFMSTGVNEAGMPVNAMQSAPSGISSLYLFFDYRNMQNALVYELRVTVNGRPNPTYSLPPVPWNGGDSGLWYIGNSGVPYENGTYEYSLYVEGRQASSLTFVVGGGPSQDAQFSDLIFGIENNLGELTGVNYVLPETNIIRARFRYRNMMPGVVWRWQWYLDGSPLAGGSGSETWESAETQGTLERPAIISEEGFISGRYRLVLEIQDETGWRLSVLSDFVVAGGAGGVGGSQAQVFENFSFAQNVQAGVPIGEITEGFASGVSRVFVFFDWRQLSPGTPWTYRWLLDGDILIEENTRWPTVSTGENFYLSLVGEPNLPDANYGFQILLNGVAITRDIAADVGLGQLPVETFASAEGVTLQGNIIDAESGEGVSGATFIILESEFSVEDWTFDNSQILGRAQTDRNGFYQIPVLLPRGTLESPILYSVVVRADGYFPVSADGIAVTDITESPLVLDVQLNRD